MTEAEDHRSAGDEPSTSALFAALAHALNNPLGSIVLAAGILRQGASPDVAAELAGSIEAEALRAAQIVGDMRALGAAPTQDRATTVDLVAMVADACEGRAQIVSDERPHVTVERAKLLLVLRRLLERRDGGPVEVTAHVDDTRASIRMVLPGTVSSLSESTLARRMAEMVIRDQGGVIVHEQDARMITWTMTFPVASVAVPVRRVLVVDDNEALTAMLALLLERDGWTVETCTDPGAVLDRLSERVPEVVLVDLHLGGCSGLDLADRIVQAHPELDGRIGIVTGDRTVVTDPWPALFKPFRWAELAVLVEHLAAGRTSTGAD